MATPTMQDSHVERTHQPTHPRVAEYHVEPDWWSRMMALGSMAVAAAALWFARHPGNNTLAELNPVGVASVAGLLDTNDDVARAATGDPAETMDKSQMSETDEMTASKPSGMSHALATSDDNEKKKTTVLRASNATELMDESADPGDDAEDRSATTLEEFIGETDLVNVPDDESKDDKEDPAADTSSAVADEAPQLKDEDESRPLQLDGYKDDGNGLMVVRVDPQPLASEYAITLTVRNTSDQLAVVSRVLFQPREIIENVSTSLASRSFGVSSPSEMALAFSMDDNRAEDRESQGRYVHELPDTFQIPADTAIDIRLAIKNDEHLGYGLRGKLTLEYNIDQSLDVENTPVAFITEQDE